MYTLFIDTHAANTLLILYKDNNLYKVNANREKEKCKEQEKTIIAANKEKLIYDIAENTNTVIKSINQQSEELIKYLQLLINSVGYKLEKNLGKIVKQVA